MSVDRPAAKPQGVTVTAPARQRKPDPPYFAASCHKTYFGEVGRPPASYFSMSVGAIDVQVASPERVPELPRVAFVLIRRRHAADGEMVRQPLA
jgi:hypothetical protein